MSKIGAMLDVGKRSLMNSQTALQTVSHNIANKSTEGYSRQRVDLETSQPLGMGKLRIGMGARAAQVSRTNNPFLEKQLEAETGRLGFAKSHADGMGRIEQIFNEQINKGLNRFVSDLFNAFRDLANNPESAATRALVKETASFVTQDLGRIHKTLLTVQAELDQTITAEIEELNVMSTEVAQLNQQIQTVELQGSTANDERDKRDLLIKKMGEKINIKAVEGKEGSVTITAGDSAILVSGYSASQLRASASQGTASKREGCVDIYLSTPAGTDSPVVTKQMTGGAIGGALKVRDQVAEGLLSDLDEMAYTLATNVNAIHQQGFTARGEPAGRFFDGVSSKRDAAASLKVSSEIMRSVDNIAAGALPGASGDNRIANDIAALQNAQIVNNDSTTLDGYYQGMVGRLAVTTKKANSVAEHQQSIVDQLKNIRESVSGVSLDEEAMKMIEHQKHFEASARLIKVADDMLTTVIGLVGR
jgi:flagellar hook-associated protein 1 FlgK